MRLLGILWILLLLAGCTKPQAATPKPAPPAPPVGESPRPPEPPPAVPQFAVQSPTERLVLETLFKLATGYEVPFLGSPHWQHLPKTAEAWQRAGLGKGCSVTGEALPLKYLVDCFPFIDMAAARVLYLDRSAEPERYAALVHVPPMSSFVYMTLEREATGYRVEGLSDTQVHTFRRAPEEDLRLVSLAKAKRWDELERVLIAPLEYLAATERQGGGNARPLRQYLADAGEVQAFEGSLVLGAHDFAFDWVKLPDGAYKVVGARYATRNTEQQPIPVTHSARQVDEATVRETASRFMATWGSGQSVDVMVTDMGRFQALSDFSAGGHWRWPWFKSSWTLAAEHARLTHGYDLPGPLNWESATIAEVVTGPLPRARIRFAGSPVEINLYVAGPGKVSSLEVSYNRTDEMGNGVQASILEKLPRLDDPARGVALLEALARGDWEGAAGHAGVKPAELEPLLALGWRGGEPLPVGPAQWAERLGGKGPVAPHPGADAFVLGDLAVRMRFTGSDGSRRLEVIGFGKSDETPWLPVWLARPRGLWRPDLAWDHPVPHGDTVALLDVPGEWAPREPIRFYLGAGGKLKPVAEIYPPGEETVWYTWAPWIHPDRAEWWLLYGPQPLDSAALRAARITWEGEQPVLTTYPGPGGWALFDDVDGDGIPEALQPSFEPGTPALVHRLVDGTWRPQQLGTSRTGYAPLADRLGRRVVWQDGAHLMAAPLDGQPTAYEAQPETLHETGGLVWWLEGGALRWLAPGGPVTAKGSTIVAVTQESQVLVSGPGLLRLYTLEGALLWEKPFLWDLESGILADMDGDGRPEVIAHARHPHEFKLSRVLVLKDFAILWEGPVQTSLWSVDLAVGDLDGTAWPEIFVMTNSGKGYTGFDVYSDSTTDWGPPVK